MPGGCGRQRGGAGLAEGIAGLMLDPRKREKWWLTPYARWATKKIVKPAFMRVAKKMLKLQQKQRQQRGGQVATKSRRRKKKTRAPTLHEQYFGQRLHFRKSGVRRRRRTGRVEPRVATPMTTIASPATTQCPNHYTTEALHVSIQKKHQKTNQRFPSPLSITPVNQSSPLIGYSPVNQ